MLIWQINWPEFNTDEKITSKLVFEWKKLGVFGMHFGMKPVLGDNIELRCCHVSLPEQ